VAGCTNRSLTAADVIEDEVQEALAILRGTTWNFRSDSMSDERLRANATVTSTLGSSGLIAIAGNGPDNSTTLGVTTTLSSLRTIHSSLA
jgi:hypothetical protein